MLSVISPLTDSKILGRVSPLLSSLKNQKLKSSSTIETASSTSASAKSRVISPGWLANQAITGELSPEIATVPLPFSAVNGTIVEVSSCVSGAVVVVEADADDVGIACEVVALVSLLLVLLLPFDEHAAAIRTDTSSTTRIFLMMVFVVFMLRFSETAYFKPDVCLNFENCIMLRYILFKNTTPGKMTID